MPVPDPGMVEVLVEVAAASFTPRAGVALDLGRPGGPGPHTGDQISGASLDPWSFGVTLAQLLRAVGWPRTGARVAPGGEPLRLPMLHELDENA